MWNAERTALAWWLAFCLLVPPLCIAQTDSSVALPDTTLKVRAIVLPDTLGGTSAAAPALPQHRQAKSPWTAVGLSAIAPGAGQIYDESYWKAPVIWALSGYWVYEWMRQNDKYREFRDLYNESITEVNPAGNSQYQRIRDFYHDDRDKFAWFLGGLYFLNLLDAYVGAHLYDFDVSPDLTADGHVVPRVTATVRLTF